MKCGEILPQKVSRSKEKLVHDYQHCIRSTCMLVVPTIQTRMIILSSDHNLDTRFSGRAPKAKISEGSRADACSTQ